MEKELNVASILKDKLQGIRLYSPIFGECEYKTIIEHTCKGDTDSIKVKVNYGEVYFDEAGKYIFNSILSHDDREPLLFPSKEMRDWHKFAWKKGDVLVNSRGLKILFDRWANDNYTSFYAKTSNLVEDGFLDTNLHTLASEKEAKSFIKCIEEKLGGKLNRETLEVEKAQPEFKDGDIVHDVHGYNTYIIKEFSNKHIKIYAGLSKQYGAISHKIGISSIFHLRLATEKEKQQLFSALAKEGKAWDAEKKEVVGLKPKVEFKPFDKVLVRDNEDDIWEVSLFGYKDEHYYRCDNGIPWIQCIPYDGNEHLLGTTNNVEG